MKNVLMMLLFLVGFAATEANAQVCCKPCPPACYVTTCTPEQQKNCTPDQMKNCTAEQLKSCSKEEMKACGKSTASTAKSGKACCAAAKKTETADVQSNNASTEAKPAEAAAVLAKND